MSAYKETAIVAVEWRFEAMRDLGHDRELAALVRAVIALNYELVALREALTERTP